MRRYREYKLVWDGSWPVQPDWCEQMSGSVMQMVDKSIPIQLLAASNENATEPPYVRGSHLCQMPQITS
jgi:hypothetical protein